jgi:energy-coupling factor transporter ATP-binding protein EcfA2
MKLFKTWMKQLNKRWFKYPQGKLFEKLSKADKKGIFKVDQTPLIGYPTPFPVMDWANGFNVRVPDVNNPGKFVNSYPNIGTFSGQFIMVIGNSGTGKSAYCIQSGSHIIRPFKEGLFIHIDGEHSSNPELILKRNKFTWEEYDEKYKILEIAYVEDLYDAIVELAKVKLSDPEYLYDTGLKDFMGKPIIAVQPTVILIDSLPTLQTKENQLDKAAKNVDDEMVATMSGEMEGQSYNMRLAIAYNTFYKRLRPIIYKANIIVYAINHLKDKPQLAFSKEQAKIQYLKPTESIPGGSGPIYFSQTLLRFKYKQQYTFDKNGFDGYLVNAQVVKSKTNRSGRVIPLVFDHTIGFDPWKSMLEFCNSYNLVQGRNPYCYFKDLPDVKFNTKTSPTKEVWEAMAKATYPYLYQLLDDGTIASNELEMSPETLDMLLDKAYTELPEGATP